MKKLKDEDEMLEEWVDSEVVGLATTVLSKSKEKWCDLAKKRFVS